MKHILFLVFILYGVQSFASNEDICKMSSEDFQKKSWDLLNRTSFRNFPGPMRTGVCWWHSRLQRSALYLAIFDQPNAEKPTREQAMQILEKIAQNKAVVSVPGFTNWMRFSYEYEEEIKFYLGRWEITDTVQIEFRKGMRFNRGTEFSMLQKISKEVNDYKRIAYVMVDLPQGAAHSWLVPSIDTKSKELTYIDSNFPLEAAIFDYDRNLHIDLRSRTIFSRGSKPIVSHDRHMNTEYYTEIFGGKIMSLVLQNEQDYSRIASAIYRHCRKETPFTDLERKIRMQKRNELVNSIFGK